MQLLARLPSGVEPPVLSCGWAGLESVHQGWARSLFRAPWSGGASGSAASERRVTGWAPCPVQATVLLFSRRAGL